MSFRSSIEEDFLTALALTPNCTRIERNDLTDAERLTLYGPTPSAPNRTFVTEHGEHTPDFRMWFDGTLVYVEVGPADEKYGPLLPKLQAAALEAVREGSGYLIVTERDLRCGQLALNSSKLYSYLDTISVRNEDLQRARSVWEASPRRLNVMEVAEQLRSSDADGTTDFEAAAWAAMADACRRGKLYTDFEGTLLAPDTRVALGRDDEPLMRSFIADLLERQRFDPSPTRALAHTESDADTVVSRASTLSEAQLCRYRSRLAVVLDREQHPEDTWAVIAERHGVSPRFARYHWEEFLREDGRTEALLPLREARGVRLPDEVCGIISKLYRSAHAWNAKQIWQHPEIQRLRASGQPISYKQVSRYISFALKNDASAKDRRMGRTRLHVKPFRGDPSLLVPVLQVLGLVEVDETAVDCFVLSDDEQHVLSRLHILYAVDVATGMIVGWVVVTTAAASETDYLKLLAMVFSPKDDLVREIGAQNPHPGFGIPLRIRCDRGRIFTARRVAELLNERKCKVEYAAPEQPTMKPHVERMIRKVRDRVLAMLPGAVNADRRSQRDAVEEARRQGITLSFFERLLALAFIDGLHLELLTAKGYAPLDRWHTLEAKYGPPQRWPSDPKGKLDLELFALSEVRGRTRRLDPRGYHVNGIWYRPTRPSAPETAVILYDPEDARQVRVLDTNGNYVCVAIAHNVDLSVAMTVEELAELRRPSAVAQATSARGTAALASIVERAQAGKPLGLREATKLERARRAAAKTGSLPAGASADDEDVELELDTLMEAQP